MRLRFVLCPLILAGLFVTEAFAYPMNPTPYVYDNQGDSVTLRKTGDEHYHRTQTIDGYLVVSDSLGVYYYANEEGVSSGIKAKDLAHRSVADKKFLESLDSRKLLENHRKRHPDPLKRPRMEKSGPAPWAMPKSRAGALMKLPASEKFGIGTNRFPVILVQGRGEYNRDSSVVSDILNKQGYSKDGYVGSVRDYFADQSGEKFVPIFDIYSVSINYQASEFKTPEGSPDTRYKLGVEAIKVLKTKYPNFDASLYDSDGDGDIDATGFLYAGTEKSSGLSGFVYNFVYNACGKIDAGNGKKFSNYLMISQETDLFATFIHEFGHTMGLQDHYCVWRDECYYEYENSQYQAPGVHAWDVMGTGMYNGGGKKPAGYSAFERNFMGWLDYEALDSSADIVSLEPLSESNKAYKIAVPGKEDEWFIVENRQRNGRWDDSLPGHGMLIWHIDYNRFSWISDSLNDYENHQRIDVVEAGNLKVTSFYDGFETQHLKDDPFPGYQKITSFTGFKSWSGQDLGIGFSGIMEENSDVCFTTKNGVKVTTCKVPVAVVSSSSAPISSSSSLSSSSSATDALASVVADVQNLRLFVNRSVLEIESRDPGIKRVDIFDLQGNLISRSFFEGGEFSMNLDRLSHLGMAVVRVSEGSRILGTQRINLR